MCDCVGNRRRTVQGYLNGCIALTADACVTFDQRKNFSERKKHTADDGCDSCETALHRWPDCEIFWWNTCLQFTPQSAACKRWGSVIAKYAYAKSLNFIHNLFQVNSVLPHILRNCMARALHAAVLSAGTCRSRQSDVSCLLPRWRHFSARRHDRHLEITTSNQKSVCIYTRLLGWAYISPRRFNRKRAVVS